MKCSKECPSWDAEDEICMKLPSEIDDVNCLLRNQVWLLNILIEEIREQGSEGEDWKYPTQ